jgi:hypothetical protein
MKGWVQDPRRLETLGWLDGAVRSIAARLGGRGLVERRRKLLETHLRMLEHPGDPAIGFFAALTRVELAGHDGAIATLRAALQRFPADRRLPGWVEATVAEWIASEVNPYPSGPHALGEPMTRSGLDPEAHAARVIRELECQCEALGHYPNLLPAVALQVAGIAASRGAEQRGAGHLDDARHTAACLSAFARTLARRNPNEAAFRMLRCMAFEQESKNAWRAGDHAAIELALRQALSEAGIALRLEPRSAEARVAAAALQDKLIRLSSMRGSSP